MADYAAAQVQGLAKWQARHLASDVYYAIISYEQIASRVVDRPADVRKELESIRDLIVKPPTIENVKAVRHALQSVSPTALLHFGILPDERSDDDPINTILRDLRGRQPTRVSYDKLQTLINTVLTTVPDDAGGPQEDGAAMALMKRLAHLYTTHTGCPVHHSTDSEGDPKADFTKLVSEVVRFTKPEISEAKAFDCIRKILPIFK